MDFLLEKNKKSYLEHFNISTGYFIGRRIVISLIFLILYGLIIWMYPNPKLFLGIPIVAYLGYKIPYIELLRMKKHEDIVKEYMFPNFLRYFLALLETQGNVYQTLRATIDYVDDPIKTELINLIEKLDDSSLNSRDAFMDFADFIGTSDAYLIMGVLHEFNEEGIVKKELDELDEHVSRLQENKTNEIIEARVNSLSKHADPILAGSLAYVIAYTIILIVAYMSDLPI